MPRIVALLLCFVFIWILFKMDPRGKCEKPWMLWIPTFWALIIGSRMVSQWFSGTGNLSAEAYADGSPMDRNIFLGLIVTALVIVIKRKKSLQGVIRSNRWIVLFLVYCAMSIMWSDFPVVSFKRYIKELGNLFMTLVILSESDPFEAILTVLKRCAYILVPLSIVLFRYYSELGRSYGRWTGEVSMIGVTNNKNSLGVLCAVCGIGLFACLLTKWRKKSLSANKSQTRAEVVAFALTIWVLFSAKSATSIGCCTIGILILIAAGIDVVRRNIIAYTICAVVFIGAIFMSGVLVSATAGALGRDQTLTGRTEIWGKVVEMTTNPLMGGGYSSFWLGPRMEKLWSEYAWHPTESHDGYLEIYIDLGLIGVGLIAAIIFSAFRAIARLMLTDPNLGAFRLAMLAVAMVYNVTESAFRPGLLMYFAFVIIAVNLPRSRSIGEWSQFPGRECSMPETGNVF